MVEFRDVVKKYASDGEALGVKDSTVDGIPLGAAASMSPVEVVTDPDAHAVLSGAFVAGERVVTNALGDGPNITFGHAENEIASDLSAATIGGGGQAGYGNVVGGDGANVNTPTPNTTTTGTGAHYSVITGGYDNSAGGLASVISGFHNKTAIGTTHGTIAGGSVQTISAGDYGTIGGGTLNTVSATQATVSGGRGNTASGVNATVNGGLQNTASGQQATVVGGQENVASGITATVVGGRANTASGAYSTALGRSAWADTEGEVASASGVHTAAGDAQYRRFHLRRQTTDDTPTTLGTNPAAAPSIPTTAVWSFTALISAATADAAEAKGWKLEGTIRRGTSGAAVVVGTLTKTVLGETAGASTWDTTVDLSPGGSFLLRGIGAAATTIRWYATVEVSQVVYAA